MGASVSHLLPLLGLDCFIQGIGFLIAASFQTEKFYDLAGTGTFLALIIKGVQSAALRQPSGLSLRQMISSSCVALWSVRLGLFLFFRALHHGDSRFDGVRDKPKVFAIYWAMQAAWIFVTLLPVQLMLAVESKQEVGAKEYIGWGMWAFGFVLQATADYQKSAFKANVANKNNFISTGVWAACQHPNYFGEMMMWAGLWLASSEFFSIANLSVLSPLFVIYLLRYVSGVPILQKQGQKRWGKLAAYQEYVKSTPLLFPNLSKLF